ncbi:MAG: hypothetical protein U9P90_02735 [Patescibacteria group bacterium]|nr:hypothetical protein [Patescibacteria group bacterium]
MEEITEKQLKWSYWIVKNKTLFKKIGISIFIVVDMILVVYGLYGFADYLFITGPREAREIALLSEELNYSSVNIKIGARPLDITSTILLRGKETFDALSFVKNKNKNWLARFKYQFSTDGQTTESKNGFILPGEGKFITALGIDIPRSARHAVLLVDDLKWNRISTRDIPDYEDWSNARLDFDISDINFAPVATLGQGSASKASFKVKNLSAFNYWQVGFRVILYRGATIVGINYATIPKFRSGEEREVEATWFDPIGQVTKVEIEPEVDIFDEEVYMR